MILNLHAVQFVLHRGAVPSGPVGPAQSKRQLQRRPGNRDIYLDSKRMDVVILNKLR